jgi:hypothetical protein
MLTLIDMHNSIDTYRLEYINFNISNKDNDTKNHMYLDLTIKFYGHKKNDTNTS